MVRSITGSAVLLVCTAACASAPSDAAIRAAAEQVSSAPPPEVLPTGVVTPPSDPAEQGTRIDGSDAYRVELCSDGSCPIVVRRFDPVVYPRLDVACTAFDDWVVVLGGEPPASCDDEAFTSMLTSTSTYGSTSTAMTAVIPDGRYGDTVLGEIMYTGGTGVTTLRLSVGEQFCSDSVISEACADG